MDGRQTEGEDPQQAMLELLGRDLAVALEPATLRLPSGERVEIDGTDPGRTVLVECWPHQGPAKAAQRHKVLADAFKLNWIGAVLHPGARRILCLGDPEAARPFLPRAHSWAARAMQDLGIEVRLVLLPDPVRARIVEHQRSKRR